MFKKFKLFSKLKLNVLEHPKITHDKLKRHKWLKLKTSVPRRTSDFGGLLLAKQKLKAFYGNCPEHKFVKLYKKAKKLNGNTGVNFIQLLECRLDSVLFRMRLANTFEEIHQLIAHKHVLVNNSIVTSKSFSLKPGDIISIQKDSFEFVYSRVLYNKLKYYNFSSSSQKTNNETITTLQSKYKLGFTPDHLEIDYKTLTGVFIELPSLADVVYPYNIDLSKIMEYYEYSRKL